MDTHKMRGRAAGLAAAALLGATSWCGTASAAPVSPHMASLPTHAVPGVKDCGQAATTVRPKTLILACADANSVAKDLVWSTWGPAGAQARGTLTWNTCTPNCAASKKWDKTTASFHLGKLVHTAKYGWLYEQLTVKVTGKAPAGMPRVETYPEQPVK